jgi:hypothetical protein
MRFICSHLDVFGEFYEVSPSTPSGVERPPLKAVQKAKNIEGIHKYSKDQLTIFLTVGLTQPQKSK